MFAISLGLFPKEKKCNYLICNQTIIITKHLKYLLNSELIHNVKYCKEMIFRYLL